MKIRELFQKDLFRPINGVVKADQLDPLSVWQELDEYVVTKELDRHLREFFSSYLSSIDNAGDPDVAGKVGDLVAFLFTDEAINMSALTDETVSLCGRLSPLVRSQSCVHVLHLVFFRVHAPSWRHGVVHEVRNSSAQRLQNGQSSFFTNPGYQCGPLPEKSALRGSHRSHRETRHSRLGQNPTVCGANPSTRRRP